MSLLPLFTPVFNRGIVTPPDLALTNDQYTKLLLHGDFVASPTTVIDHAQGAAAAHTFTLAGAATQTAASKKFGQGSFTFGGVNADYMIADAVSADLWLG